MVLTATALEKCGWRIPEWASAVGISRSTTYELITEKRIASIKLGGMRIITTNPREFLRALADGAQHEPI